MARANGKTKIAISEPNFQSVKFRIIGTAPLMIHKFSTKQKKVIEAKQTAEDKVQKARKPKDYKAEFDGARYISAAGWDGLYAGAIRNSMIAASRHVDGLNMTSSKGLFFVQAQGFDKEDGTPLVRIFGAAKHDTRPVKLESGTTDMRNRPRYDSWHADVVIDFDADAVSATDVANLLHRAGVSVGLCEGRPQSKDSFGIGFGTFRVEGSKQKKRGRPGKTEATAEAAAS